ncbi:phage tail assembly protein [Chitinibacter sp. ZOR0017]|uniref:phage tail assembly protein n=1 Tax=Chitinibacter sp. ZOR0017 TaxID=1339254 RepID=UPI00068D5D6A|nr:phage tail assembly protein [Chitinibacter sp. ZOR0017]
MAEVTKDAKSGGETNSGQSLIKRLMYGVEFDGKLHSEFDLRLPTMGDNIAVFQALPEASGMEVHVSVIARCLTRLGEIPVDVLSSPGWLAERLVDDDYDLLSAAILEAKKKRKEQNSASLVSDATI